MPHLPLPHLLPSALGSLALVLASTPSLAQEPDDEPDLAAFLELAEELRTKTKTPGVALALFVDGELLHLGGLGYADLETRRPADEHTLFAIGSCTKAFTGFVASRLADRGQITWWDPAVEFLPQFELNQPYLTEHTALHDLLTHQTGLGGYNLVWYGSDLERKDLLAALPYLESHASLRRGYIYNNIAYAVAGCMLEEVSGKTWDELIREEIFEPLGMDESVTTYAEFMATETRSTGYDAQGTTALPHMNADVVAPAGAIGSNARDMARWMRAILKGGALEEGGRLLSEPAFRYATAPQVVVDPMEPFFYGLGWEVQWIHGKKTIGHGGGIVGQNAYMRAIPEAGYGIVVLANQQSDFDDLLVRYAEDLFVHDAFERDLEWELRLEEASSPPQRSEAEHPLATKSTPNRPLGAYAATYQHAALGRIEVTGNDEGLRFHFNYFEGPLVHVQGEHFVARHDPKDPGRAFDLHFETGENGAVKAVRMSLQGGLPEVTFPR